MGSVIIISGTLLLLIVLGFHDLLCTKNDEISRLHKTNNNLSGVIYRGIRQRRELESEIMELKKSLPKKKKVKHKRRLKK